MRNYTSLWSRGFRLTRLAGNGLLKGRTYPVDKRALTNVYCQRKEGDAGRRLINNLPLGKGKACNKLFKRRARGLKINSRACHNLLRTLAGNNRVP